VSFNVSRTVWFGNGYGVEFVITDPFTIAFNVITEKDPTLVVDNKICLGSDACYRQAEVDEEGDIVPGTAEPLRDFAIRARLEGISFAEQAIIEHKESLDLSSVLNDVLKSFGDTKG